MDKTENKKELNTEQLENITGGRILRQQQQVTEGDSLKARQEIIVDQTKAP